MLAAAALGAGCSEGSVAEDPTRVEDTEVSAGDTAPDAAPDDADATRPGDDADAAPDLDSGELGDDVSDVADGLDEFDGLDSDLAGDTVVGDAEEDLAEPEEPPPPEEPEEPDPLDPVNPVVKTVNFRSLHWNIAGGKENNCEPDKIRRAVMRFVREAPGPIDFIGLNEICHAQYVAIRDALEAYWGKSGSDRFAAYQRANTTRDVGIAIFSRRNIYGVTRLEIGQDQYGKRFLLCGRQENRRVRVCTTHLTPADSVARRQLALVLDQIEAWWADQRDTVVIGGDFNLHPNDAAFDAMYAAGANTPNNPNNSGSYRELDDDDPDHCRGYGERTLPNTSGGPCGEGGKIDFIFTRANRIVNGEYSADSLNIPTDCTGVCSDHRPVRGLAKIKYRID